MIRRRLVALSVLMIGALLSVPTLADAQVSMRVTDSTLGTSVFTVNDTNPGFQLANGQQSLTADIGEVDGTIIPASGPTGATMYLWCTDIQAFAVEPGPTSYTVLQNIVDVTNLDPTNYPYTYVGNTNHQSEMAALLGNGVLNIDNLGISEADASAAIQAALWALIYEDGGALGTDYSVTSGNFQVTDNDTVAAEANTLLGYVSCQYSDSCTTTDWTAGNYTLTDFDPNSSASPDVRQAQSLVQVMQSSGSGGGAISSAVTPEPVPEPSSLLLLGVGLVGLVGLRRPRLG